MTGVSDIKSELRTNSKGALKFFSDTAKHNVKFTNYPSHLDNSMFPTSIQGYINDLSEIVVKPDVSKYYGYQITVKNSSGSNLANHTIKNSSFTTIGTTDANGVFTVYSTSSSLSIAIMDGNKYYTGTITGTLGGMKTAAVTVSNTLYTGTLSLGNKITFIGKEWLVVNKTAEQAILARSVIESKTAFHDSRNAYNGSTLAGVAKAYENKFSGTNKTILTTFCPQTTVNGVTARIFVPSYEQVNGGFSYFSSNEKRICQYNGSNDLWWTSSPNPGDDNYAYYVYSDGSIDSNNVSSSYGFRPFVALAL